MLRLIQGAADLTGDFTFAHHGGFQPGHHGEQVPGDFHAGVGVHGFQHEPFVQSRPLRDTLHDFLLGTGHLSRGISVLVGLQLAVELQPIARGEGHRAIEGTFRDRFFSHTKGTGAEPCHGVEVDGAVRGDKTEKDHNPAILDEHFWCTQHNHAARRLLGRGQFVNKTPIFPWHNGKHYDFPGFPRRRAQRPRTPN